MRPTSVRTVFTRTAAALLLVVGAAAPLHSQGTTTATIRGRLRGPDGNPVAGAVAVTNTQTGVVRRTIAGDDGRYTVFGLQVGGPYTVRGQAIGYRPQEKAGYELAIGDVVTVDFALESAPVEVSEVSVTADAVPVVDAQQAGLVARVSEQQIAALPTNGRNFSDFIALTPQVATRVGNGSGGELSIGGGRRGANNILIDGVGNNGTFFGGEARGSDRIAFAYSIEAVREFQVETNAYDVTRGNYTGGLVNAVTRSGTNRFRGTLFGYRRSAGLTKSDFLGRAASDFSSDQFGISLSGPIIRDRLHFLFVVDRQNRDQPTFAVDVADSAAQRATGVARDSLIRLMNILQNVYGYDTTGEQGRIITTVDETSIFARLDWQLSNNHQLSLRYNSTRLLSENDRISPGELRGNGGDFIDRGRSFVGSLTSTLGRRVFNELRVQRAKEPRPRPGNSPWPEIFVDIRSDLRNSAGQIYTTVNQTVVAGADNVLHFNDLLENTWQFQDNLTIINGNHTLKLGTDNSFFHVFNFFGRNGLGAFTFRSLADLENRAADQFTRAVPADTTSAVDFATRFPKALYDVREWSFYAQDQWQATPRLNLTFGLRYDVAQFPDAPAPNPALQRAFPELDVSKAPVDNNNWSPRFGFTYDMSGSRTTIVRGGAGLFYGRSAYVLFSNAFLNTGNTQLALTCRSSDGNVPTLDVSMANDHSLIPEACVGGGAAAAGTPNVNAFAPDFRIPRAFKGNIGVDHAVNRDTRIGFDFAYSHTDGNYYSIDRNLATVPQFFTEGGRPVYAPPIAISSTGGVNRNFNRVDASFGQVLVAQADGESDNLTFVVSAAQRLTRNVSFQASYTYSHSMDAASQSCCTQTGILASATAANPNDIRGARTVADFDRPHTFILSGIFHLPWGFQLSGIYRGFSGLPWTPLIRGDANGDGFSAPAASTSIITGGADRAYVGTNILYNFDANSDIDSTTQKNTQQTTLQGLINDFTCLRAAVNTIIRRNACRQPWTNQLDMRLTRRFNTVRGQSVEFVADFFNVLNFFNHDWGQVTQVIGANQNLLIIRGFNQAQRRFVYDVNPSFGTATPSPFSFDQFSAQLGLRYNF